MASKLIEKSPSLVDTHTSTKPVVVEKKTKNLALAITLVVVAVLLIIATLVALLVLPHFGLPISPLFGLLAIPIVVGLVKMAIAIFILHKPEKLELQEEEKNLENYFIETFDGKGNSSKVPFTSIIKQLVDNGALKDLVASSPKIMTTSSTNTDGDITGHTNRVDSSQSSS